MKVLVLNPVHPATPHISAVRAFRFSSELVRLGHSVCLATGEQAVQSTQPSHVSKQVMFLPQVLEVSASSASQTTFPAAIRRSLTALHMLRDGGWNYAWGKRVVSLFGGSERPLSPDVIWVSFGKLEAVIAAQRISRILGIPWVLDIKDNWELYVPHGLRRFMAFRTSGWSALTANSQFFAQSALRWQGEMPEVVYSGVDDAFLGAGRLDLPNDRLVITLVGGLYYHEPLVTFLRGVEHWRCMRGVPVEIRYAGGDQSRLQAATAQVPGLRIEGLGYLPIERMAQMCRSSHLNAFVSHPGTFHHKVLELATSGRPVLACPSDGDETKRLIDSVHGTFLEAADEMETMEALDVAFHQERIPPRNHEQYSWSNQALILERVLKRATENFRGWN